MNDQSLLLVDGEVAQPHHFTFDDLANLDPACQIQDVSRMDASKKGDAVSLGGLLDFVSARSKAAYIGLHSSTDDFHASIPLGPVREKAILIYRMEGSPLNVKSGGPVRFFIPDHSACHTDEIDECANVKFVDHIELTVEKGFDNRPQDDEEHERLHEHDD